MNWRGEFILIPLRRPHLVLPHAGGDVGIAVGEVVKHLDNHLLEDDFGFLALEVVLHVVAVGDLGGDGVVEGGFLLPFVDLREPRRVLLGDGAAGDHGIEAREGVFDVADDGEVGLAVLVELGGVNVHMNDGALLAKLFELAGHAVVEAHAEGEEEVGAVLQLHLRVGERFAEFVFAVDRPVGESRAVHAEPAEGQGMGLGGNRRRP